MISNIAVTVKICSKCHISKNLECFRVDRNKRSGRGAACNECEAKRRKEYYHNNKQKNKENHDRWMEKNREYANEYRKFIAGKNPNFVPRGNKKLQHLSDEEVLAKKNAWNREYRKRHKERDIEYRKQYNATHREENCRRKMEQEKKYPQYKMANRLRARTRLACRAQGSRKMGHMHDLLGCSPDFFRQWIERNFEQGMTWENWGRGKGFWNIDHLIPCNHFDLTDPEEQKKCFHWSNMFPMWAVHNLSKSDNIYIPDYQI